MRRSAGLALEERAREEDFYRHSPPRDKICSTVLAVTPARHLQIMVNTPTYRYSFSVIPDNPGNLGFRDCQAFSDCLLLAERGTTMTPEVFVRSLPRLRHKFGRVHSWIDHNRTYCAAVIPGTTPYPSGGRNCINYCNVALDIDGDVIVSAATLGSDVFRVCIQTTSGPGALHKLDCRALLEAIALLETGNNVSPENFYAKGYEMRKNYNFVNPKTYKYENRPWYVLTILASGKKNTEPIDTLFLTSGASPGFQSVESLQQIGSPSAGGSPYPGITYTRKLKDSGQAQVYIGRWSNEKVAIKVFTDQESESGLDVYKIELRMLLKMNPHPNVVQVLDFYENPQPALLMNFIEGEDLMDYIKKEGRFNEREGRELCKGIARGMCHLHKNGVVHRDLKSLNVMRRADGVPVIIDLGMGSFIETRDKGLSTMTVHQVYEKTANLKGTVLWMAPEMVKDQVWSDKTDVYAFGIIMWEIFSGLVPFQVNGRDPHILDLLIRIREGATPDVSAVSHISEELRNIIMLCWKFNPKERPSMRKVLDLLNGNDPQELFRDVDQNRDGMLNYLEFHTFLEKYAPGRVPDGMVYDLFKIIDDDGNGKISAEEFERFWRQVEMCGIESVISSGRSVGFAGTNHRALVEST